MTNQQPKKRAFMVAFVILSCSVVGYFTGLQSPLKSSSETRVSTDPVQEVAPAIDHNASEPILPATNYSDMSAATYARAKVWKTSLATLKNNVDPLAEITIRAGDKEAALRTRAQNRAFNGAPPTIPHPIDQRSDLACIACHRDGVKSGSLRIPRMSHQLLANCTQCHVESNPQHMPASLFRQNDFVGLPAPNSGPRAFPNAPPQIPHSTWMRSNCLSCHGFAGHHGIRTTHPWRHNCQQCHTASTKLDQALLAEPQFLPPPEIE